MAFSTASASKRLENGDDVSKRQRPSTLNSISRPCTHFRLPESVVRVEIFGAQQADRLPPRKMRQLASPPGRDDEINGAELYDLRPPWNVFESHRSPVPSSMSRTIWFANFI